jgi:hypothetical protein
MAFEKKNNNNDDDGGFGKRYVERGFAVLSRDILLYDELVLLVTAFFVFCFFVLTVR